MVNTVFVNNGIQVIPAGVYFIHYELNVDANQFGTLSITQNGVAIRGTTINFATATQGSVISGSMLAQLAANTIIAVANISEKL